MVRSGGVAGRRVRASVDTRHRPRRRLVRRSAGRAGPAGSGGRGTGRAQPDRYQYVLSVQADDGSSHRLELGEAGLPDALRPLVTQLESRARAH